MDDKLKIWTTVGSAGTLNQADLAKVTLHNSIIQVGIDLSPPPPAAAAGAARPLNVVGLPTIQAVARYNITPVDGLFFDQPPSNKFHYGLELRYLGHVTAKLREVDLRTGNDPDPGLVLFDSTKFAASASFKVETAFATQFEGVLDFVNKAYYVEATLVAPALVVGHPAAISIIKVVAKQPDF
jgi:hypothetical protein